MPNETADTLVRYVRNADSSVATGSIKHLDDDRPDLNIGDIGYVTSTELAQAAGHGVVLEPLTEKEAEELGLELPTPQVAEVPLGDLPEKELERIAKDEGVDLTGKRSKADKAEAIQAARSAQPEGVASLPATAGPAGSTPAPTPQASSSGTPTSSGTA